MFGQLLSNKNKTLQCAIVPLLCITWITEIPFCDFPAIQDPVLIPAVSQTWPISGGAWPPPAASPASSSQTATASSAVWRALPCSPPSKPTATSGCWTAAASPATNSPAATSLFSGHLLSVCPPSVRPWFLGISSFWLDGSARWSDASVSFAGSRRIIGKGRCRGWLRCRGIGSRSRRSGRSGRSPTATVGWKGTMPTTAGTRDTMAL